MADAATTSTGTGAGTGEDKNGLRQGRKLKVAHHEHARVNWGWRFLRSLCIVSGIKTLNVEDFTSLLDQLLLVDTLLLGFAINMMTASAVGKSDYLERDAWSLSMLSQGAGRPGAFPGIMSYDVVKGGALSVSFLFLSLSIALFLYVMLNLSEARESERIFEIWARYFIIPVWISLIALVAGLYYFYECYNRLVVRGSAVLVTLTKRFPAATRSRAHTAFPLVSHDARPS